MDELPPVTIPMDGHTSRWVLNSRTAITNCSFREHFRMTVLEDHGIHWPLRIFRVYRDRYTRLHVLIESPVHQIRDYFDLRESAITLMRGSVFLLSTVNLVIGHQSYKLYFDWRIIPKRRISKKA